MQLKTTSLILIACISSAANAQGYAKSHQPALKSAESMAAHQAKPKVTKQAKASAARVKMVRPGEYVVIDKNGVSSTFKVTEKGKKGAVVWRRDLKTGKITKVEVKPADPKAKH